jgi:hypothetical protein
MGISTASLPLLQAKGSCTRYLLNLVLIGPLSFWFHSLEHAAFIHLRKIHHIDLLTICVFLLLSQRVE